ncbi:MAG: PAS domain-containing protein [Alphaproteobacteria bacterium]|nr:PAS domain-containing protein [Alphaproteobacteria bacterium]
MPVSRSAVGASEPVVKARPLDLAECRYPELNLVFDYWDRLRGDRIAPRRREIDPVGLKLVLPRITFIELDPGTGDFRFRLAGTDLYKLHNKEIAYTSVAEMRPAEYRDLLQAHYSEVVQSKAPNCYEIYFITDDDMRRYYASLRVPLSEDNATVNALMTIDNFSDRWSDLEPYFDTLYGRQA